MQIKKTIYAKGKSIDGQTHYGENVLLTYSLHCEASITQTSGLYNSSLILVLIFVNRFILYVNI